MCVDFAGTSRIFVDGFVFVNLVFAALLFSTLLIIVANNSC